jgi:hypothetical protein
MKARGAVLALVLVAAGCNEWPSRPAPGRPRLSLLTPPRVEAQGTVRRIRGADDVPLASSNLRADAGDWLLEDGDRIALVDGRTGRLDALAPRGHRNGLHYIDPTAFDGFERMPMQLTGSRAIADGSVLQLTKRALTRPLEVHQWLYFSGGVLHLEAQARSLGEREVVALTLGEVVAWSNTPSWLPGHGFIDGGGSFGGAFLARESAGLAYAMCSTAGRLIARFSSPGLPGFHRTPRTGERFESLPVGGRGARRHVALSYSTQSLGDAAMALPCGAGPPTVPLAIPEPARAARWLEVASCREEDPAFERAARGATADNDGGAQRDPGSGGGTPAGEKPDEAKQGKPFARFVIAGRERITLPEGCFVARLTRPGHAPGAWRAVAGGKEPLGDPLGDDAAQPKAGTLRWAIRDPNGEVMPAKLLVRGRAGSSDPDWGEDPHDGAARNFVYSTGDGQLPLAPGSYRVSVQRGPEFSAFTKDIQLRADDVVELNARLERVVDTRGWLSADLHVHALPSFDAPTLLAERVRSLVAVGVEVAVATDHNAVTDYRPVIERMSLEGHLHSIVGDEVTTEGTMLGHFNVFPLQPGAAVLPYQDIAPHALFRAARSAAPDGLIQVNHPRMGDIGYFELLRMDRGAIEAWQHNAPLAEMSFDAIEVFSGDHYADIGEVEDVLKDWYALLDAGRRYTATGNSDSHKVAYQEAGVPRNWVLTEHDDPKTLDPRTFVEAVRARRVVVSSGPFIDFRIAGQPVGSTVPAGEVELSLRVDAPDWIDVSQVTVLLGGRELRRFEIDGNAQPRLDTRWRAPLPAGAWLIAVARGRRSMPHLYRRGARPFAFTNPIWIR